MGFDHGQHPGVPICMPILSPMCPLNTTRDVSKNTPEKNYKIESLLSLEAYFPIGHLVCSR